MQLNEFEEYFTDMNQSWHFAKPDDTSKLLGKIGYVNINVHLHDDRVKLSNRQIYSKFVRTVIMKPFLERIPNDKIRNRYLKLFLDEIEERSTSSKKPETPWSLDYVRLNITADKP
jgi:trans-aconitate 2-methyltransferase